MVDSTLDHGDQDAPALKYIEYPASSGHTDDDNFVLVHQGCLGGPLPMTGS